MEKRRLGRQGLVVPCLGLGCMGMSYAYGRSDDTESVKVLHRALDIGVNFWDSAEMYGPFSNEELLGRAIKGRDRGAVIIATKFAWRFSPEGRPLVLDGSPGHIKESLEGSLRRLGTDYVDLYYQHRLDPATPIEVTMGALADLVRDGKVRYVGLSEVGPGTIRRAHAVHPLTAVQTEYSLWERGVEEKVLPTLRELGIGFVAYAPLGRGFLTGKFAGPDDLQEGDWRRNNPRFREENFRHNLELVEIIRGVASAHGATPAQVALGWLLRRGDNVVPIPGTRHVRFLEENAAAVSLNLPDGAWVELDREAASFRTAGARYPEEGMKTIDRTQ